MSYSANWARATVLYFRTQNNINNNINTNVNNNNNNKNEEGNLFDNLELKNKIEENISRGFKYFA